MSWELKEFYTNEDGTISGGETLIPLVRNGIKIEETVGDEYWLKSGDLRIVTDKNWTVEGLTSPTAGYWVSAYNNGSLVGVYSIMHRSRNENFRYDSGGWSEYRLRSLQNVFFEQIAAEKTSYSSFGYEWNAALTAGIINISTLKTSDNSTILNRYGFSLGDMISAFAGKHNKAGYLVDTVTQPIALKPSSYIPILFRGQSKSNDPSVPEPESDAVNWTFYWNMDSANPEYWGMTWRNLFEIASFGWNAFISVRPKIVSGQLKIDLEIVPKINATVSSTVSTQWIELSKKWYRYKVSGVKISISNDEFVQGDSAASNVFERSITYISNPDKTIPGWTGEEWNKTLYWTDAFYRSATVRGYYDYNQLGGYFATGKVEPYYQNMIVSGHGYSGKCIFEGQKLLDQISHNGETFQIIKIVLNDDYLAAIDGVIIS